MMVINCFGLARPINLLCSPVVLIYFIFGGGGGVVQFFNLLSIKAFLQIKLLNILKLHLQ